MKDGSKPFLMNDQLSRGIPLPPVGTFLGADQSASGTPIPNLFSLQPDAVSDRRRAPGTAGIWIRMRRCGAGQASPAMLNQSLFAATDDVGADNFDNHFLSPLLHQQTGQLRYSASGAGRYVAKSRRLVESLDAVLDQAEQVWVVGHTHLPVGAALRKRGAEQAIGHAFTSPFPAPEIFALAPNHRALAELLFAYDFIGFQTRRDCENFVRYTVDVLDGDIMSGPQLRAFGKTLGVGVLPVGIDTSKTRSQAALACLQRDAAADLASPIPAHLIVGFDQIKPWTGVPQKLSAYEHLLDNHRPSLGSVSMCQVIEPDETRAERDNSVLREVQSKSSRINGNHDDLLHLPLKLLQCNIGSEGLTRLYRRSHVGYFAPLCDSMSLAAKEFVAAQLPDDPGVLVLSAFSGAAERLTEAVLVNPYDVEATSGALVRALSMRLAQRRKQHQALLKKIRDEDFYWWQDAFAEARSKATTTCISRPLRAKPAKSRISFGPSIARHHAKCTPV